MPGYTTHITCGGIAGAALGLASHSCWNAPIADSCLVGVLCSIGSILPDIDSKTSISFQRCLSVVAGFAALMLVSRLRDFDLTSEMVVVIGGGAFVVTYACFGTFIKKFTRHRGMCHSIPMGILAAEIIYILSSGQESDRIFKASAIFIGVMIHLLLDEFYSVQISGTKKKNVYIKKSLGTAIKMIDFDNIGATVFIYVLLGLVTDLAINEPVMAEKLGDQEETFEDRHGKDAIDFARRKYPVQFDIAVVEWIAENRMVLEPGTTDNEKWQELTTLFDRANKNKTANATDKTATATGGQNTPSFLEQINWSSRHGKEPPESPRKSATTGALEEKTSRLIDKFLR